MKFSFNFSILEYSITVLYIAVFSVASTIANNVKEKVSKSLKAFLVKPVQEHVRNNNLSQSSKAAWSTDLSNDVFRSS